RMYILALVRYLAFLAVLITVYSVVFHLLMAAEGQQHSWLTGFYWTLTVMSTLGFGDITFHSDIGRLFSMLVLISGVVFLLVLMPFTVIRFFWAPWVEAEERSRTPRELPPETSGHVIITGHGPVDIALARKLRHRRMDYVIAVGDYQRAVELYDEGIRVAVGNVDDPETYRRLRVERAALVVAANRDEINTNIAFTVRELSDEVRIVTTAESVHSVDILNLAGSNRVLQLFDMLGRSLANWTLGGTCRSNVISRFGELLIAEFPAVGTPLVGKTLADSNLRENFDVSVVGIWERGSFSIPTASTTIGDATMLVLAGSQESLDAFDETYSFYHICRTSGEKVLIIGGGRVGRTIAAELERREVPFLILEKDAKRARNLANAVVGDAADFEALQRAWIDDAPAALVTTHDDDTNIYLTKYFRSLRPDMQILSRATQDRNVSTLHRAGADFVMSLASVGSNAIFNYLKNQQTLLLVEGLNIFRTPVPAALVGQTLAASGIRQRTGCSVAAVNLDGTLAINPRPDLILTEDAELIVIGDHEGEKSFLQAFRG
ncbi:MAG TPA: NAD-binding protein, partial [Candidatus Sulfomarinibacteraceae bacterium]|nr:NAD-binding protein [Candidatus Sulfomarinibacteraceae bacterium]